MPLYSLRVLQDQRYHNYKIIRCTVRHAPTLTNQTVPLLVTHRERKFSYKRKLITVLETTDEMSVFQNAAQNMNIC